MDKEIIPHHSNYFLDLELRCRARGGYVIKSSFEEVYVLLPTTVDFEETACRAKEFSYVWDARAWLRQISQFLKEDQSLRDVLGTFDSNARLWLMSDDQVLTKLGHLLVDGFFKAYVVPCPESPHSLDEEP